MTWAQTSGNAFARMLARLASTAVDDGAAVVANSVQIVADIATLATITPTTSRDIYISGHTSRGDGGQGQFYGVTGAAPGTYVDNGGTIIVPGDGSAAWLRRLHGEINVSWFGSAATSIQAAHDASVASNFEDVVFEAGEYTFTTLTWSPHVNARARGKVYLETANASGRTIQVSDEYGLPVLYGLNSVRDKVFGGQFYVVNTAGTNTATAWAFGGATAANYCNNISMEGVETRGFDGGVYEFRFNAFNISFYDCFEYDNNSNRIIIGTTPTNTGEGIRFYDGVFGTGNGYLLDINNASVITLDFVGCSVDYLLGLNKTGNTAALLAVNWAGGHMEWDTVAAPYLQNDCGATWSVRGAAVVPTASSGWPTVVVSQTTGAGTTDFTDIKYVLPGAVNTLHDYVSATSRGELDAEPNYQGGNSPAGLVTYHVSALIGYDGITYRALDFTPTWSGTIGNGTLIGTYTRVGNRVDVSIKLVWGTTTTHGAANQTFSIPYTANASFPGLGSWWANDYGTGNRTGTAKVSAGGTALVLYDDVAALQVTDVVPITWGNLDEINLHLTYFV